MLVTSLVVLALAAGLLALVRATAATSDKQDLQLAVGNFAESLKAMPYEPCATAAEYETAYLAWPQRWVPPADTTVEIVEVEYWHRTTGPVDAPGPGDFLTTCPASDEGTQRLTVRASLPERGLTAELVKGTR